MNKKETLQNIHDFMCKVKTNHMTSNDFIYQYHKEQYMNKQNCQGFMYFSFYDSFINGPSVESILRCRRKVISDYGIGHRTKADKQETYIKEFDRNDRYNNTY